MGVFARLSDIVAANINALLDKAENPERMLAQIVREMEDGLAQARQQGAVAIAAERRLSRELEQNRTAAVHRKEQARLALSKDREDLARQALTRSIEHDDIAQALEPQWAAARVTSTEVKSALNALAARLAEARRKQRTLIARHRVARIRLAAQKTTADYSAAGCFTLDRFARVEDKLVDMEDHVLAQLDIVRPSADIEAELGRMQAEPRVDEALQALKKEMQEPA